MCLRMIANLVLKQIQDVLILYIYIVRPAVDHYIQNESTINLCFIDVSKVFDKVNHAVLFMKLMKQGIPAIIIPVLKNWHENVEVCVKWNSALSQTFKVTDDLRQGGIL